MFRLFFLIHFYDKSNSCSFASEKRISQSVCIVLCCFIEKRNEYFLFLRINPYFCSIRGEKSLGQECVSCFILFIEIWKISKQQRDGDNATLILFVYHRVQPTLYPTRYIRQRGVFVSQFISVVGFPEPDKR